MLHQRDYFIGPRDRVVEASVVAIAAQKQPHRCERGALVSLLECVGARDACHQSDRKRDNVLFTEAEEIARTRQCIFKKAKIANEMALASFSSRLCWMMTSIGSQCGSFGKGGSDLRIFGDMLAT